MGNIQSRKGRSSGQTDTLRDGPGKPEKEAMD